MILTICAFADTVCAQTIGVFADSNGTDCNLRMTTTGVPVRAYVVITVSPRQDDDGFVAAWFRIQGFPTEWQSMLVATPRANIVLGDAFGDGMIIARSYCERATRYVLAVFELLPTTVVDHHPLSVLPHEPFSGCGLEGSNCGSPCPHVCGCTTFARRCECLKSIPTYINGDPCLVRVQSTDWSSHKTLYR
jgi:hypothetical protein